MLERGNDVLRLHASNGAAHHAPGLERVFTRIFKVTAATRVTRKVRPPAQQDVKTAAPCLPPDHLARLPGHVHIPTTGCGQTGWQGDRRAIGRICAGLRTPTPASDICKSGRPEPGGARR